MWHAIDVGLSIFAFGLALYYFVTWLRRRESQRLGSLFLALSLCANALAMAFRAAQPAFTIVVFMCLVVFFYLTWGPPARRAG